MELEATEGEPAARVARTRVLLSLRVGSGHGGGICAAQLFVSTLHQSPSAEVQTEAEAAAAAAPTSTAVADPSPAATATAVANAIDSPAATAPPPPPPPPLPPPTQTNEGSVQKKTNISEYKREIKKR